MVHLLLGDHLLLIEVEGELELVSSGTHGLIAVEPLLDGLYFLHLFLRTLLVFPEIRSLGTEILLLVLHTLLVYLQVAIESICSI